MNALDKECIEITYSSDIVTHKYIFPLTAVIVSIILSGPVLIKFLQNPKLLDVFSVLRFSIPLLLFVYSYYLGKPIVSCKVCRGYLIIKGYGKPVKVDFDNICSIDNAEFIRESGKEKCLVAIKFWRKTAFGQRVKVYLKRDNTYKGKRMDAETYLVNVINNYSQQKTLI
jgi:hypothetical protein